MSYVLCRRNEQSQINRCKRKVVYINDIITSYEYSGHRPRPRYFKTARGSPIDLIWNDSLIKISSSRKSQVDYDLSQLRAALKKLKMESGVLPWGYDQSDIDAKGETSKISTGPWTKYS
jgi:hypothetical protein